MNQRLLIILSAFFCIVGVLLLHPTYARAEEKTPEDYLGEFADSLPPAASDVGEAIKEGTLDRLSDMASLTALLFGTLDESLSSLGDRFATLLGLLLLTGVASHLAPVSSNSAVTYGVLLVTLTVVYRLLYLSVLRVDAYLDDLVLVSNAAAPVMSVLSAAGGNVTGTAVAESGIAYFLIILENLCHGVLLPLVNVSFGFIAVDALGEGLPMGSLLKTVRTLYTTLIGFFGLLLSASLGMQTALASSSDGLLFKGARYLLGSFVPAVGSLLGGSLGTAIASVSLLRSTFGVGAAIAVIMLILPVFLELFLMRTVVSVSAGVGEGIGAPKAAAMLRSVRGVYDMLIAVTVIPSLIFLFILALFARTGTAVSA